MQPISELEEKPRSVSAVSYGLHSSELPPNIEFYKNTFERKAEHTRPSIGDLLDNIAAKTAPPGTPATNDDIESTASDLKIQPLEEQKKFGWIEGVFVRCLQNIIGVILYIRLAWVCGQAGILMALLIIVLSCVVTVITTISTAAITTNGEVKGGGVYYLISRTLGPEFGGSIGLIFCCANAVGAALYLVGFAETIAGIFVDHGFTAISEVNLIRIIGVATCVLLMAIIIIGISIESKLQQIMLIPFTISVLAYVIGSFIHTTEKAKRGFTGYNWVTFKTNLVPEFSENQSFFTVFSIYFPAATGIMAGANISGDLKNPQKAIPKGTLVAIACASVIYAGTVLISGATFVRHADGNTTNYISHGHVQKPPCFSSDDCQYGLLHDKQTLADVSVWSPLIIIGIVASTLSSALASLVSAPKVFQAVAADDLFPYIGVFKKGYGRNNDPRRAYALTFAISTAMILIGELDVIAPIISNFFLGTYTLVNYACFDASYSESPGFRPAFRFYSMWVSLFGAIACVAIMFVMSYITALATFLAFAALFIFLKKHKPEANWGSSMQANQYKSTLASLQRMDKYDDHVKNYRPQILVLTGDPSTRPGLVDFAGSITRGSSLLVCGNVLTHTPTHKLFSMMQRSDSRAKAWLRQRGIKAFSVSTSASSLCEATTQLAQTYGIGKLVPNVLFLGFKANWPRCAAKPHELDDYVAAIQAAFDHHLSVCVLRNKSEGFDVLDKEGRTTMMRASQQWPRGEPPRGRLSLNPEENDGIFAGGALQSLKNMKKRFSRATVAEIPEKRIPAFGSIAEIYGTPELGKLPKARPSSSGVQVPSPFCVRLKKATIDVWWLSDDGGLTLLLSHLLTLERSYLEGAQLRVFTLSSSNEAAADAEKASMMALLRKFRIDFEALTTVHGIESLPHPKTMETFETLIAPFRKTASSSATDVVISDDDLHINRGKTYRHLRCGELLQKHSDSADLIVVTLPVPSRGVPSVLYLSWIELITRGLPPTLLVRGNHSSVLTFYS